MSGRDCADVTATSPSRRKTTRPWIAPLRTPSIAGLALVLATAACDDGIVETPTLPPLSQAAMPVQTVDRAALVALYNATGGPDWTRRDNWLSDKPLDDWYGITTDEFGHVLAINLSENNLTGSLPEELGDLFDLVSLQLQRNELTGSIPAELGNLTSLGALQLNDNNLTGGLPEELSGARDLVALWIANNDIGGLVPRTWLRFGLLFLDISGNGNLCMPGTWRFVEWRQEMLTFDGSWCHARDIDVLTGLHEAMDGDSWTVSEGWLQDLVLDTWFGVTTDSLGKVVRLRLPGNGLSGELPEEVAELENLTRLDIGGNDLTGQLPKALMDLALEEFRYADTELCVPDDPAFRRWLNSIGTHRGTGVVCPDLDDRQILQVFYEALGGENWINNDSWLTDAPLDDWYGVDTDGEGNVVSLRLPSNLLVGKLPPEIGGLSHLNYLYLARNYHLEGPLPPEFFDLSELRVLFMWSTSLGGLPPEIGRLSRLQYLSLNSASLTGTIPPELGELAELRQLDLSRNYLFGDIPPELGKLSKLEQFNLFYCELEGRIPPELGNLSSVKQLNLRYNHLTGELPATLGGLRNLEYLGLSRNLLTGPIPVEFGNLESLKSLLLESNSLDGPIPATLGNLKSVETLYLHDNDLEGPLPDIGDMEAVRHLWVGDNPNLSGPVPLGLTRLTNLRYFKSGGTELCAPRDAGFFEWLTGVPFHRLERCEPTPLYLVQSVQSREFPVPLVPGRGALLRVFVASEHADGEQLPHMRATFHVNDSEVHVAEVPYGTGVVPKQVDEGNLGNSLNAPVPAHVIRPGLEVVVELDGAAGELADLGIPARIPATGRMALDVADLQDLRLTLIPFLYEWDPDSSIIEITEGMAENPDGHPMLAETRTFLPIAGWDIVHHDPVVSSTNNGFLIRNETEAMRRMEGRPGYWLSMMGPVRASGLFGVAYGIPSWTSYSIPVSPTVAHELGHNMGLWHAPCGGAGGPDPLFPHKWGTIGSWGYDHEHDRVVNPHTPDIMSYCGGQWVSDYHMANALRHRMYTEATWNFGTKTESLLVWGWVDRDGVINLDPSFIVDALPSSPPTGSDYTVTATTTSGTEAFSFQFDIPTTHEVDDQRASFVFMIPVTWSGDLASVTLSGNNQAIWIDEDTNNPMTILRDPVTGQVRAFLRHEAEQVLAMAGDPGLEVLFSRGLPR